MVIIYYFLYWKYNSKIQKAKNMLYYVIYERFLNQKLQDPLILVGLPRILEFWSLEFWSLVFLHTSQTNGFSPVWVYIWLMRLAFALKAL